MKINMETIGYSERETMNAQVETIAKQYLHQGLSLAELIDEGNLGYRKAVETFDEEKHKSFEEYAIWWIRQNILQALAYHIRANKAISC